MTTVGVSAEELKAGTVISAANIDKVKNDTFEGHKIGDMIPDKLDMQIRKYNQKLTLRHSAVVPIDKRLVEASKNSKAVYDPKTRTVQGWVAGAPFPNVKVDDPHAADKLMWNHHYGQPHGNFQRYPDFAFVFIDGKRGVERTQIWTWNRYFMKGRLGEKSTVEGDGKIFTKVLMFAKFPKDIAGLGTYTIRYDSPGFEDSWAYLKSVRRVRRLPGGTWMDPLGGTDMLNDDQESFNAYPTWYKSYKLLGKKWVLGVAHSGLPNWIEGKAELKDKFPRIDSVNAPYWNSIDEWEPREVWVIEAVPPPEHPYSKKILYLDAQLNRILFMEAYDRKGEFWKWMDVHLAPIKADDGSPAVFSALGFIIDVKKNHATVWVVPQTVQIVNASKPNALSLGMLEAAGR
ncbi:MAG: DUF1329 domain-containing protein [Desulfobacteria bacterium]